MKRKHTITVKDLAQGVQVTAKMVIDEFGQYHLYSDELQKAMSTLAIFHQFQVEFELTVKLKAETLDTEYKG